MYIKYCEISLLFIGGIYMEKKGLFFPITIVLTLLLVADLLFKGAIYRQLPVHIQENIDQYVR